MAPLLTPLLSATLASRGDDAETSRAITAMQQKQDWAGLSKFAQDRLVRDPSNPDWWTLLGYALQQQGLHAEAFQALTRATQGNPEDIDAWNLLADTQRRLGQPGASARTLERAVNIDPTSPITRFLLGEAYREDGRYDAALAAYREALTISPKSPNVWFGLGVTMLISKRMEGFEEVTRNLQQLDPALGSQLASMSVQAGSSPVKK